MSLEGVGDDFESASDYAQQEDEAGSGELKEIQNRTSEAFRSGRQSNERTHDGPKDVFKKKQEIGADRPFAQLSSSVSQRLPTLGISDDRALILGINGISTSLQEALAHQAYLNSLAGETIGIDFIYNHSHSKFIDILETALFNYGGFSPNVEKLLVSAWMEFHEKNKGHPERKILQICHSQAALHVYNALANLPKEITDRLIIVSIAPAKIFPEACCHRLVQYASKRDCIYLAELTHAGFFDTNEVKVSERSQKILEEMENLILLDPHPDAKGLDHGFESPTFKPILEAHLREYLESACGERGF